MATVLNKVHKFVVKVPWEKIVVAIAIMGLMLPGQSHLENSGSTSAIFGFYPHQFLARTPRKAKIQAVWQSSYSVVGGILDPDQAQKV